MFGWTEAFPGDGRTRDGSRSVLLALQAALPADLLPRTGVVGSLGRLALIPVGLLLGLLFLLVFSLLLGPSSLLAQSPGTVAAACHGGQGDRVQGCTLGAATAHAFQSGFGLLLGAGGPFPASPNTAGQRLHGSPRFLFDAGLATASFTHPDMTSSGAPERRRTVMAPRLAVGVGVFEGVSPAPTVGGVGAVDLLGEVRFLPVPAFDGLDGRTWSLGAGARIGVMRESFSLPGLTLSAMHRRSGALEYLSSGGGAPAVAVTPRVTSFRAVLGKDLMEIGVSGGVQQDRIRGEARVRPGPGAAGIGSAGSGTIPVDRTTWFVGVNRTWVVSQIALELGWSPAPSAPEGIPPAVFGGSAGGISGALTFRIRY